MITLDTYILDITAENNCRKLGDYAVVNDSGIVLGVTVCYTLDGFMTYGYITGCGLYDPDILGIKRMVVVVVHDREKYPVTGTEDQKIAIVTDGGVIWRPLRDVNVGDLVCVPVRVGKQWQMMQSPVSRKRIVKSIDKTHWGKSIGVPVFNPRQKYYAAVGGFLSA